MKMNRGRSSDSLDNGIDDIISSGSSSSTEFTSDDDEVHPDSLYMISGQPRNRDLRSRKNNAANKPLLSRNNNDQEHSDFVLYRRNMLQGSNARQAQSADSQNQLTNQQLNYIDPGEPSTSYFNNTNQSNHLTQRGNQLLSSRIPDIVPDSNSIALLSSQTYEQRVGYQNERFHPGLGGGLTRNISDFDSSANSADQDVNTVSFEPLDSRIDPALAVGPRRARMFTLAARELCARLVECRSIIEAIEFVDQNRELIDSLTRVVTRDASAFLDYDISNYQIDYSVKDSFNPHFWHDREPVVTTADGNCQYHAVSISLTGGELYTQEVRLATAVAVIDNREWFDSMLKLIDRGSVLDLVHTIARSFSWGDETTLKAVAVAIKRRIFLYTCNIGKKDYEVVKSLSKDELLDAFKEKKYRGGTGIHTYADPFTQVSPNNYIMLFHKSEHFIAVLPTTQQPTMFEPYNPIVPVFS